MWAYAKIRPSKMEEEGGGTGEGKNGDREQSQKKGIGKKTHLFPPVGARKGVIRSDATGQGEKRLKNSGSGGKIRQVIEQGCVC